MNDPDDPDGVFSGDRCLPPAAAGSTEADVTELRLTQMRARVRPVTPLALPDDPVLRELVLEQIALEAEAHAEQVELQMGWHDS